MKLKSKLLSIALSAALAVTVTAVPVTSFADGGGSAWEAPESAMAVDDNIVKVGIHAAASTTAFFLGGNVVAERASDYASITGAEGAAAKLAAAQEFVRLGAFGSASNISPDPYLWNYFYNLAVDAGNVTRGERTKDEVYISEGAGSPISSDTTVIDSLGTSYTLDRRPEVLMDKAGGYADLIAQLPENTDEDAGNNYNPISLSYDANNFEDLVSDMYNLSDAIKDSKKAGRYGDTEAIAESYEAYMKGMQLYIMSKIADGTVAKKKVAVIDTVNGADLDNDGAIDTFQCVDNTVSIGTSTDRPSESIMYISDNIFTDNSVTKTGYEVETAGRNGQVTKSSVLGASAKDIAKYADVIIQAGHTTQTEKQIRDAFKAAGAELAEDTPVYAVDPADVFSIRANSVENFAGVGIFGGFLYPEIVNPIYATMYIYEKFWHLNPDALVPFANANFAGASLPAGVTADGSGYNGAEIQAMIDAGLQYYVDNEASFQGTTLEVTDRLSLPEKSKTPQQSKSPQQTVKPTPKANTLTVKAAGKTLKAKALKKKAASFKALTVSKAQGKVTYTVKYANSKAKKALKFNQKTGKITVKKKTKKGTYKVKITVKAAGNTNYKAASVAKTITVKVK
ncbi:MAG: hypothetical protein IJ109_00805 [Firmicutes bacterium]|nr:hypothetical protein [Bacillota bacterium]